MRKRQIIKGLNNSQKVRVIVNGVGFYTTVEGATEMPFTEQRIAVWNALQFIADRAAVMDKISGYASRVSLYNDKNERVDVDFQVDLL
jgi:hypothetical protein